MQLVMNPGQFDVVRDGEHVRRHSSDEASMITGSIDALLGQLKRGKFECTNPATAPPRHRGEGPGNPIATDPVGCHDAALLL